MYCRDSKRKGAFILTELLIVVAIIAVLAGILFPILAKAKAAAKKTTAISNCKQVNLGRIMYQSDYDDDFVPYYSGDPYDESSKVGQYWPGLISTYVQKSVAGAGGSGGQIQAQDLCRIFFDPGEPFTFPSMGANGNISSWGISDDIVNWAEPPGVDTTYIPVSGSKVAAPSKSLIFAETWDWLAAGATGPGCPGSALALSFFDGASSKLLNPPITANGAVLTLAAPYN